jgi:hypothetical protein
MPSEVAKTSQKELTKEQAKLQSSVHFSVINVAPDGTAAVGFSDNSNPKAPVHHYVKVGEESGGWKVLSADTAEKTMTIQKDGVELTLKLGDNSGGAAGGSAAVPAPASASALRTPRRSGLLGTLGSRRAMRTPLLPSAERSQDIRSTSALPVAARAEKSPSPTPPCIKKPPGCKQLRWFAFWGKSISP